MRCHWLIYSAFIQSRRLSTSYALFLLFFFFLISYWIRFLFLLFASLCTLPICKVSAGKTGTNTHTHRHNRERRGIVPSRVAATIQFYTCACQVWRHRDSFSHSSCIIKWTRCAHVVHMRCIDTFFISGRRRDSLTHSNERQYVDFVLISGKYWQFGHCFGILGVMQTKKKMANRL